MKDKGFPPPTLPDVLEMESDTIRGLAFALENNATGTSDYGDLTLKVVRLLLLYIEKNMNDGDTIIDIIKPQPNYIDTIYSKNLYLLNMSFRTSNCLKRAGKNTVGDVAKLTEKELMSIRNFGKRSFDEVVTALAEYGITLKDERSV